LSEAAAVKTCTKCGETKPLDDFGLKLGKRTPQCRQCLAIGKRVGSLSPELVETRRALDRERNAKRAAEPEYQAYKKSYAEERRKDPDVAEYHRKKTSEWMSKPENRARVLELERTRSKTPEARVRLAAKARSFRSKRRDDEQFEAFMGRMEGEAENFIGPLAPTNFDSNS